jgi:hypothetical protein
MSEGMRDQRQWVYDKDGKGRLCKTREEARECLDNGDYFDHPDGGKESKPTNPVKEDAPVETAPVVAEDDGSQVSEGQPGNEPKKTVKRRKKV